MIINFILSFLGFSKKHLSRNDLNYGTELPYLLPKGFIVLELIGNRATRLHFVNKEGTKTTELILKCGKKKVQFFYLPNSKTQLKLDLPLDEIEHIKVRKVSRHFALKRIIKKLVKHHHLYRKKNNSQLKELLNIRRLSGSYFQLVMSDYQDLFLPDNNIDSFYPIWRKKNNNLLKDYDHKISPLISIIIPTFNSCVKWLEELIKSIESQVYTNWEVVIADDGSTNRETISYLKNLSYQQKYKVIFREKNGHISECSNTALENTEGVYIALIDHDDLIHQYALAEIVEAISNNPKAKLIYTDEDKVCEESKNYFTPHFKPDFNQDLLLSHNYISHLSVYESGLIKHLGGFRKGFEGSQDYDLLLRALPYLNNDNVIHIPKILYHWRVVEGSTAKSLNEKDYCISATEKALVEYLQSENIIGTVQSGAIPNTFKINYDILFEPLVSLIIPTKNKYLLLKDAITSILEKTTYKNFEIIIVDNLSTEIETLNYLRDIERDERVRVIKYEKAFNYSAINNYAVKHAKGKIVGFINNDIKVITPEWLYELVSHSLRKGIGAVGAKLYYANETIQHAGVILGLYGVAGHIGVGLPRDHIGYVGRLKLVHNLSAVTAACLIVKKSIFEAVGGFNETDLAVAFNDIDLCLKISEKGYRNVWTPYAELYHYESLSRGSDKTEEQKNRFQSEVSYMMHRWGNKLKKDPHYNQNFCLNSHGFNLK